MVLQIIALIDNRNNVNYNFSHFRANILIARLYNIQLDLPIFIITPVLEGSVRFPLFT